jgi:two-component sensor histidine kinase
MCPVRSDQALLIGLIVGELMASAVRFARRVGAGSKLALTCGRGDGGMEIGLGAGGAGVSRCFDPDRDGGVGLGVARLLVAQLKASLTFETGARGFVVRLLVPGGLDLADLDAAGEA